MSRSNQPINSLPNEILLRIFRNLTYYDLKLRLPLVCQRFKSLILAKSNTGALDKILFRDTPNSSTTSVNSFTLHPILVRDEFACPVEWNDKLNMFLTSPAGNESAISPSVTELMLGVKGHMYHSFKSLRQFPVSVRNIVDEVKSHLDVQNGCATANDLELTFRNVLYHWRGIDTIEVKDGELQLYVEFEENKGRC